MIRVPTCIRSPLKYVGSVFVKERVIYALVVTLLTPSMPTHLPQSSWLDDWIVPITVVMGTIQSSSQLYCYNLITCVKSFHASLCLFCPQSNEILPLLWAEIKFEYLIYSNLQPSLCANSSVWSLTFSSPVHMCWRTLMYSIHIAVEQMVKKLNTIGPFSSNFLFVMSLFILTTVSKYMY